MSYEIFTFYRFFDASALGDLPDVAEEIRALMNANEIVGTVIIAREGVNSTVCGRPENVRRFIGALSSRIGLELTGKSSFSDEAPFKKVDVKIKPEIVTLKQPVNMAKGEGTHVSPEEWNGLVSDPEVYVLDTRNDYEFRTGTFKNAHNPKTRKFSDLPDFVSAELDPAVHKRVAMFCTGGIRCEKFAPYLKGLGFEEVYQLEGGILKYLETIPAEEQLWSGECFVFDTRRSVDPDLNPGTMPDLSLETE